MSYNRAYASAPVGDLRWKAPVPPKTNRSAVLSNSKSIICVQGTSSWQLRTSQYTHDYLKTGNIPNVSYSGMSATSAGGVEDCLFLDVLMPRKVFNNAREKRRLAPVLVWIHGKSSTIPIVYRNAKKNECGGFTAGSKTSFGSSKGLVDRSQAGGLDGVVYVAFNYRLGSFGFLSGPSFQVEGGMFNAGLYDQRFALQWIQDNIHLFGGDKGRVTVFGESGGGGSIMHHATAYGGAEPALCTLQSGCAPVPCFLSQANVISLAEARKLRSDVLIEANVQTIGVAQPYNAPIYGPTPDDRLVKEDPKVLLHRGQFDSSVKMLISHNSNEGLVLVPAVHTDEDYETLMKRILTRSNSSTLEYITKTLFRPVFDGSMRYRENYQRAALTAGDVIIDFNAAALESAYKNMNGSHSYAFGVRPGIHAQDTGYTFYAPNQTAPACSLLNTGPANQIIAFTIQDYILSLTKESIPSSPIDGLQSIPSLGSQAVRLNKNNITTTHDPAANRRCQWWLHDLFD